MITKKKKLLIHVGPPKTATTSFQYWLEENDSVYSYLGALQPRKKVRQKCYVIFWKFINGKIDINNFYNHFNNDKKYKDILIFSEEMILTNNWIEKIERIAKLSDFFDLSISYCYRESVKVVPSYYAEIHIGLPDDLKVNYELFLRDRRCLAYDLEYLSTIFEEYNLRFNIFNFNSFTKGGLSLNTIFNLSNNHDSFNKKILLKKENTRKNKIKGVYKVIDKNPIYPKTAAPYLLKVEKIFDINLSSFFRKNYQIKIDESDYLVQISHRNEVFFQNFTHGE